MKAESNLAAPLRFVAFSAPLMAFTGIMLWLSGNPISPSPAIEGSASNPVGLFTSNFVYDGSINIENIAASCAFLLILFLYLPRKVEILLAYMLPVAAVFAGILAELTAISAPYANLSICSEGCSFYGMSGISSAMIGFSFATFFVVFGLTTMRARGRLSSLNLGFSKRRRAVLFSSFIVYVFLLLLFAGLIAFPMSAPPVIGGSGSASGSPSPPAILTQTPPVALVHTASLVYGFLFCLAVFALANYRYRIITLRV